MLWDIWNIWTYALTPIIMKNYGNHSKNLYSCKFILSEHPYNEDTETEQKGVKTYGVRLRMS